MVHLFSLNSTVLRSILSFPNQFTGFCYAELEDEEKWDWRGGRKGKGAMKRGNEHMAWVQGTV